MKYSQLITFRPIEDTIQLLETAGKEKARETVSSYVMSDKMAETMQAPVIDQLQMDEVVDNKGIMVVGNFGTGKSHLMSVIASVATDADNLQYLQNRKFAKSMEPIAGKFEVLRMKVDGITMPLREIILGEIEADFAQRGIDWEVPNLDTVRDNARVVKELMAKFQEAYPERGYLIVIDELLSYLTSRDERQITLDLAFLQTVAEMCSKSRIRLICGVQEKVFDNPRFSFVSDTLKKVGDRFTQIIITKEATSYVVSERILKKTPEQKARIRSHLEKFSNLYAGMSGKMEEFVEMFPIHPAYIDVMNRASLIENRHILRNISLAIKDVFDKEVPENAPGIISFDSYWPAIKANGLLRSDPTVSRVLEASQKLEDIIDHNFGRPAYKPLAIQIIYALSVHRLTTNGLDVEFGLTAEGLKDDLCLYIRMPENDAEFLLGAVNATLKEIMKTVSGQFIIHNEGNNQYYIDVNKVVDYDEKIKQKASLLAPSELNRYFYSVVYGCLDWDQKQYVTGFNIYQYDLNWASHNIFREGYLFLGIPDERSTAQPERDFYIYILPPYGEQNYQVAYKDDEVYLRFNPAAEFTLELSRFAAASSLAQISEGKERDTYFNKARDLRRKLGKYLSDNRNTRFEVRYKKQKAQLIEVLKGKYNPAQTFKDSIDLAASIYLDGHFNTLYPEMPVFKTRITRKNLSEVAKEAIDHFGGRKTKLSAQMLESFGVLEGDKIKPENSKYAAYYIDQLKKMPPQGVLNYSDLFQEKFGGVESEFEDKKFRIDYTFTPIVFLSMVYAGYAELTLEGGAKLTASNLDSVIKTLTQNLYEFRYLAKPAQMAVAELKKLFEVMGLNPALLNNPSNRETGVKELLRRAQELSNEAVLNDTKLNAEFVLWGEPLVNTMELDAMRSACKAVRDEFSNYAAKYNTPAKLNNFSHSMAQIEELEKQIALVRTVGQYLKYKTECGNLVGYLANIEYVDLGPAFKAELEAAKTTFREARDSIMDGTGYDTAVQKTETALLPVKKEYIDRYLDEHKKKRLGIDEAKRRGKIQESATLSRLKKLSTFEILSGAKLTDIETDLSALRVCYELTPDEMQANHICPHCRFSLDDHARNTAGQLDDIENRMDDLLAEWTKTLLDTVSDPLVADQKKYLTTDQQVVVDEFIRTKALPARVNEFFVKAIRELLKGFEPVVVNAADLLDQLGKLPPMDEAAFIEKVEDILRTYTRGKKGDNIRIIVK